MQLSERETLILDYIYDHGPIRSTILEQEFNLSGKEIREITNTLRRCRIALCSGAQGYWIAKTPDEVQATIDNLASRMQGIGQAIEGLEIAKENLQRGA